jgi:signal recognition particle subunit SEC65
MKLLKQILESANPNNFLNEYNVSVSEKPIYLKNPDLKEISNVLFALGFEAERDKKSPITYYKRTKQTLRVEDKGNWVAEEKDKFRYSGKNLVSLRNFVKNVLPKITQPEKKHDPDKT